MNLRRFAVAACLVVASNARAEVVPSMPRSHRECRQAVWEAAESCRTHWPKSLGPAVHIVVHVDGQGRIGSVRTDLGPPVLAGCVRYRMGRVRYVRPDAQPYEVRTRYVFPEEEEENVRRRR